ncbi:RHS repeat-associated core domain-containing protein [Pseudomonas putida]
MLGTTHAVNRNTPTVTVMDNRGLLVREVAYLRHPDTVGQTEERITRHGYDERGILSQSSDPRLHGVGEVNFRWQTSLAGDVIHTYSADAGISLNLTDTAGRPRLALSQLGMDAQGAEDRSQAVMRTWLYEPANLAGRLLGMTEQRTGEPARRVQRMVYGSNSAAEKACNLAGFAARQYDAAGLLQTDSIALTGEPLVVSRRLLKGAHDPQTLAHWQGENTSAWDARLEADALLSVSTTDATGAVLTSVDAAGNLQRNSYDIVGRFNGSWLTLRGGREQVVVKALTYSAAGQKLREEHGNGVVTSYRHEAQTQRLLAIRAERPVGHVHGAKVLQDLRYTYDPVGNVLSVRNAAEQTRFWRNQQVLPESTYVYDSLYQLVSTRGREMANAAQQSSLLPRPSTFDNATYTRYTRTYTYDNAGNLTRIRHSAPASNHAYTTAITVSDRSNRAVLATLGKDPSAVDTLFNPGGQQKLLLPGQQLAWTPGGELAQVTTVTREQADHDSESYRYAGDGQRVLKFAQQKTAGIIRTQRVTYAQGLELRVAANGAQVTERLQVVSVAQAGRAHVRCLHWQAGKPAQIANDQLRYSYDDHLGSSALEVDGTGATISREEFYPYGGTAILAGRSEMQVRYKTIRYSGKERDASGLYYYGQRYYQPWLGRWLSADPAGTVDGLNLFRMVSNNPVLLVDEQGLVGELFSKLWGYFSQPAGEAPAEQSLALDDTDPPREELPATAQADDLSVLAAGPEVVEFPAPVAGPAKSRARKKKAKATLPKAMAELSLEHADEGAWQPVAKPSKPRAQRQAQAPRVARQVGIHGTGEVFERLLPQLRAKPGFSGQNIVGIGTRPADGRPGGALVYLEKGNEEKGLRHITVRHGSEFEAFGVPKHQIKNLVLQAVVHGEVVGVQGRDREIYSVDFNGKPQYVAVSVGQDGYIVGANPSLKPTAAQSARRH